jgi:Family of unknown function (DUF5709)
VITMSRDTSDGIYEPVSDDENDDMVIDLDQVLGDDEVDEALDSSYSPPERPHGLEAYGTTPAEQHAGAPLDQRLAAEEPDPTMVADLGVTDDDYLADGEVGGARAGRLVDPDQGGDDTESRLFASDVGIDGAGASAEEAAMHIVDMDDADLAFERDSGSALR